MIQRLLFLNQLLLSFSTEVFSQIAASVNLTKIGWVIGSPNSSVFSSGYNAFVQEYNTILSDNQKQQNVNANKTRCGYLWQDRFQFNR